MRTKANALGDIVALPREAYERLIRDAKMLAALKCAGVDSWDGYAYALRKYGLTEEDDN